VNQSNREVLNKGVCLVHNQSPQILTQVNRPVQQEKIKSRRKDKPDNKQKNRRKR